MEKNVYRTYKCVGIIILCRLRILGEGGGSKEKLYMEQNCRFTYNSNESFCGPVFDFRENAAGFPQDKKQIPSAF